MCVLNEHTVERQCGKNHIAALIISQYACLQEIHIFDTFPHLPMSLIFNASLKAFYSPVQTLCLYIDIYILRTIQAMRSYTSASQVFS